VFEALKELSIGREDIYIAQAGAVSFKRVPLLVKDKGDDDIVPDGLHIERHEISGQAISSRTIINRREGRKCH